jgi:benzoyl-CoA reductase subunit C
MMDKIMDAATQVESQAIKNWKEEGKKVIGYTCSFVPAEIFYAAKILPVRLRGIETESMEIGDSYFGPYICSYPKCILQSAGAGKFSFLDGAVITTGCDAMRRLDDCWRKAGEDYAGSVPSFFFFLGIPHKVAPYSLAWFVDEIRRLIAGVEEHFNVTITEDKLRAAIHEYNKGRRLLRKLEDFRTGEDVFLSGADAFAVAIAGTVMPRKEYNALLEELISELEQPKESLSNGKKRLMVIGSVSDDISLIRLIEDSGAVVVAENLCFGLRHEADEVSEKGDPVDLLAERYLSNSVCPRMYGYYKHRFAMLKERIIKSKVDGVIMQHIRFCDLHGSENSLIERDLEALSIPCLKIELEYGSLVETGRIKMRLDAFLERIS